MLHCSRWAWGSWKCDRGMIETNGRQGRPTTSRGTAPQPRARAANRSSTLQYSHSAYISIFTYPHIHIAYICIWMDTSACWPYIHIPRYLSQYITSLSTHYTHIIITFTLCGIHACWISRRSCPPVMFVLAAICAPLFQCPTPKPILQIQIDAGGIL